jgi:hypothetical protein
MHSAAFELAGDLALGSGQQRHSNQGGDSNANAKEAFPGSVVEHQAFNGIKSYIGGQSQERKANQTLRAAFDSFAPLRVGLRPQTPQQYRSGRNLNYRIQAETD